MQDLLVPVEFVWTKFGTESGEPIEEIFARKEKERCANGGIFLWGIGNNVGPSIRALATARSPQVLFSPIASPARQCDQSPTAIARWTAAETLDGDFFEIPAGSNVTSRWSRNKRQHYALVCYSASPLKPIAGTERVHAQSLRNLVSGRQVGSSQVTSVVERVAGAESGRSYPIVMQIALAAPYFVRLLNPVPLHGGPVLSIPLMFQSRLPSI
ncbi:MAG TPA: hypothetical protein VK530_07370 [Candidatus Acidoferrum sp.]|nr:hypothetical protein [Candidatus Acidoferrum sp.]